MKTLILFFLMNASIAQAGVGQDLTTFFNKMGGSSNITRAGAYKSQQGGYYTGGNIFARNQVHSSNLATIQLPSCRAGCGGIDTHLGAFSHISSEKLLEALKAIGSNMASYAMLLAIETMSPQVKNTLTELNDLVQKINQSNMNSCELAATALGSVWPKSDVSQRHLCKVIGSDGKYGGFSDYAAARQGCGAGGRRDEIIQAGSKDPKFKGMLGTEFNLAWQAIQENAFLKADKTLSEFFMTVSGTIVSRKDKEGTYKLHTFTSMADKDALLSALLHGGEVMVYQCERGEDGSFLSTDSKCLNLSSETLSIKPEEGLIDKVKKTLLAIQEKIYTDTALTEAEIAFLNSTRLPFYKIINVSTAYKRGGSPVDIMDYAELGAVDILFQYLTEIIDVIHESADHIRLTQVDDTQISEFQKSLSKARSRIIHRRMGTFKQMEQVISIVRKTELLEKTLMSQVASLSTEGT